MGPRLCISKKKDTRRLSSLDVVLGGPTTDRARETQENHVPGPRRSRHALRCSGNQRRPPEPPWARRRQARHDVHVACLPRASNGDAQAIVFSLHICIPTDTRGSRCLLFVACFPHCALSKKDGKIGKTGRPLLAAPLLPTNSFLLSPFTTYTRLPTHVSMMPLPLQRPARIHFPPFLQRLCPVCDVPFCKSS